ncbi:MAG: LON peptidase substrate-binding domain-containing protein [Actinomycetota bacterium]|nr:LON peptidase substrate-binding domain-containing protein [Actinomycetota bacterium]
MAALPMFPLSNVLLPGALLTLHVFEPRYRALVRDCVAAEQPEFGVVLIDRGREVGGGDVRRNIGVVARMLQVAETPDGRFAVIAGGTDRLRVGEWLPDQPYPRADIERWSDEGLGPVVPRELIELVHQQVRRAAAMATELGDRVAEGVAALADEPMLASYQLAEMAPLGPADRYTLLAAEHPHARLALLAEMMQEVDAVLRFRLERP